MATSKINKVNISLASSREEGVKALEKAADIYAQAVIRIIKQKSKKAERV